MTQLPPFYQKVFPLAELQTEIIKVKNYEQLFSVDEIYQAGIIFEIRGFVQNGN